MTTISEQIKAAKQEVDRRKRNYPKYVEAGKITQLEASYQIEIMEQIVCTLTAVKNFVVGSSSIDRKVL